jgi:serine/threonine protein kinase
MTSRTVTSVVTPDTIALNAAVFGYAGHSIVTPHGAIQQIWWTNERIQAKVTREFILAKLRAEDRRKLDWRVAFGDELTDSRYIDWILERAKRLFLILVETGVPDQIFEVIDDAWDDEDLPIPLEGLANLHLSRRKDENILRKFYSTQYSFLLRPLAAGLHIDYGQNEVLPLEYVHRLPPAAALQSWLKMHPPKMPGEVYVRRKATVGASGQIDSAQKQNFLNDIQTSRLVQHRHVADVWASYTSKGQGYFLTSFEAEHTLKSFIDFRVAASIQKLTKAQRIELVLTWFFCLADAVANIHEQGIAHTAITPSNILVDGENRIAFSDLGCLKSFQTDKKTDPLERYNYGAPENHLNTRRSSVVASPPPTSRLRFSHRRWQSFDGKRSSTAKPRLGSYSSDRSASIYEASSPPGLVESEKRSISTSSSASSLDSPPTPTLEEDGFPSHPSRPPPPLPKDDEAFQPLALYSSSWQPIPSPASPPPSPKSQSIATTASNQAADIYSLGCVFVDLLTYVLKKKSNDFTKARSTKRSKSSIDLAAVNAATLPNAGAPQTTPPPFPSATSNVDASFHGNAAKVTAWLDTLASDAAVQETPSPAVDSTLPRAFPGLLSLVRAMLNRNPALRPSAADVRLRARDALLVDARMDRLRCEWCCAAHPRAVLPAPTVRRGKDALWEEQRKQQREQQQQQQQQQHGRKASAGSIPQSLLDRPLPSVPRRKPVPARPARAGAVGLGGGRGNGPMMMMMPRHEVTVTAAGAPTGVRKSTGAGLVRGLQWAWPRKSLVGR